MKQIQIDRKHMLDDTLSYLDTHSALWNSIAKIGEVKNKLTELSVAIDTSAMQQELSKVTLGKIKAELKRTIANKADVLNDLVEVFARMNRNETLAAKMADSASDLYRMKYDDMQRRVKVIIDSAIQYQEELTREYGLTAEQITGLQADYDRLNELSGQPREYQISSAVATQTLEELFTEVNNLLVNELDNLMKVFKRRDAAFYMGYEKARMVVNH
ncbi:hypothetical protein [Draconibacterium mangrovi]|uniref:hypothetical protein n=1 Tax=Draconibacterium mangrovi TaxID=2697469 RepID=UPI0013D6C89E|nr:hypothetical protein [Draconibacterium mangrovi]